MTFKASFGDANETRTIFISDETSSSWPVYWAPRDAINIFYGGKSGARFETSEEFTTAGPKAEFVGYLQAATGTSDDSGGTTTQNFWAVYPYNENNTCDGSSVTLTIPSEQTGVAGTFANNLNPTVAMSPNLGLSFYNVASWFIFTLTQENVVQATLEGANGETLVGKVKVSMDSNNRPHIDEVTEGKTLITMTPDGDSFQIGQFYCMVILPGTYDNGLVLTLIREDGLRAECEIKRQDGNPMVIERSKWARKKKADEGLVYTYAQPKAVDLGLPSGIKWASFNVGANSPNEAGGYFAWGEIEEKERYGWGTYKWANGWKSTLTKYNTMYGNGTPDNITLLEAEDDVAHTYYHGKWRMPTSQEWVELNNNCTWIFDSDLGGYSVLGPSGESIFIPLAGTKYLDDYSGYGETAYYWSSSLNMGSPNNSGILFATQETHLNSSQERVYGCSVRAVWDEDCTYDLVQSIQLDITDLQLTLGNELKINVIFTPEDATNQNVSWISSNSDIVTVSNGVFSALAIGTAIITATSQDGDHVASCEVEVVPVQSTAPVDIGLSVKWASCNLGADKPSDLGNYYAWGEITPKDNYFWSTYKYGSGQNALTKYNNDPNRGIVDNKQSLDEDDDAAILELGTGWRIPTLDEFWELECNCSFKAINRDGVFGLLISGNGNSIFFPFTGFKADNGLRTLGERGMYWSRDLSSSDPGSARCYDMFSYTIGSKSIYRYEGLSIRPVYD